MLFRYYGSYEIGGCFALLLVNATEGYWDRLFEKETEDSTKEDRPVKEKVKTEKTASKHQPEPNGKKLYRKEPVAEKAVKAVKQPKQPKEMDATTTLDIISRAEDEIDQVDFSTQTIDMEQALREFEERYKGGK
ncbi:MAG: hypothetical protein IKK99_00960 [Oscillospiraceae bacterium]|nr:hypothetical protein [Oscillospiraceae bacterium]